MKRILIILLLISCINNLAMAENLKINGGLKNNKVYVNIGTNKNKITLRSPKLSKNKYLKLVNLSL